MPAAKVSMVLSSRFVAAECIGKIGAVDPGRLDLKDDHGIDTDESRNLFLNVDFRPHPSGVYIKRHGEISIIKMFNPKL